MRTDTDFPFYSGHPVPITGPGWILLLASVAIAYAVLVTIPLRSFPASLVPAVLFLGIPLAALALLVGRHWTALFRPVGLWQVFQMLLMGAVSVIASLLVGLGLSQVAPMADNPISSGMGTDTPVEFAEILAPTVPQLIGEELLAILPLLAVLWLCTQRLGLSRRTGIALGVAASSLLFGAAHLPTYDWNWVQSLVGIGGTRVFLTLAYLWSRNLWVCSGAHIVNDWAEFTALFAFAGGHVPIGTD